MTVVLTYMTSVLLFLVTFNALGAARTGRSSLTLAHDALQIMVTPDMGDEHKETIVREAAMRMMKLLSVMLLQLFLSSTVIIAPVWLSDWVGLASLSQTTHFALRPDVVVLTVVVVYFFIVLSRKLQSGYWTRQL